MDIMQAMAERHSVRRYRNQPIDKDAAQKLQQEIARLNAESGLSIQLFTQEPEAFGSKIATYGIFSGVRNYFAIVGQDREGETEKVGYYGQQLVLLAQQLGLNTCWVALTFSKKKCKAKIPEGQRLYCVIALGYGENQGRAHRSKPMEKLCSCPGEMPEWFRSGMQAAMLAPTAVNQQRFHFTLLPDGSVLAAAPGGNRDTLDVGIAKYHFELGAGTSNFHWA